MCFHSYSLLSWVQCLAADAAAAVLSPAAAAAAAMAAAVWRQPHVCRKEPQPYLVESLLSGLDDVFLVCFVPLPQHIKLFARAFQLKGIELGRLLLCCYSSWNFAFFHDGLSTAGRAQSRRYDLSAAAATVAAGVLLLALLQHIC